MKGVILSLLLSGAVVQTPLHAQSPTATAPGENAKALARLAHPLSLAPSLRSEADWSRLADNALYNTLSMEPGLNTPPCDHSQPECEKVGKEVAAKFINDRRTYEEKVAEYFYALHFERTMSPDEITASIKFLKTTQGQAFTSAISSVLSKLTLSDLASNPVGRWDDAPYIREFRQRTTDLPRDPFRGRPVAPPLPPTPINRDGK